MRKYRDCKHQWKSNFLGSIAVLECERCHLGLHVFSDHVSLWRLTWKGSIFCGSVDFPPDPEDEEATELEPEEVTVDAEGGKV